MELAKIVQTVGNDIGLNVEIKSKENPRKESEEHYYKADHEILRNLGFQRTREIENEIKIMLEHLNKYKERIEEKKHVIVKNIRWK